MTNPFLLEKMALKDKRNFDIAKQAHKLIREGMTLEQAAESLHYSYSHVRLIVRHYVEWLDAHGGEPGLVSEPPKALVLKVFDRGAACALSVHGIRPTSVERISAKRTCWHFHNTAEARSVLDSYEEGTLTGSLRIFRDRLRASLDAPESLITL